MDERALQHAVLTADIATLRAYLDGGGYPSATCYEAKQQRHVSLLELALDARHKRERMLELLLTAGANPYTPSLYVSNRSFTVIDLARSCGESELADLIEKLAGQSGPRWHREAIHRCIDRIEIHYEKACGIQLNPYDWPKPVLYGGDYEGPYPISAAQTLECIKRERPIPGFSEKLAQLRPLLERMARGEDFGLDEMVNWRTAGRAPA